MKVPTVGIGDLVLMALLDPHNVPRAKTLMICVDSRDDDEYDVTFKWFRALDNEDVPINRTFRTDLEHSRPNEPFQTSKYLNCKRLKFWAAQLVSTVSWDDFCRICSSYEEQGVWSRAELYNKTQMVINT